MMRPFIAPLMVGSYSVAALEEPARDGSLHRTISFGSLLTSLAATSLAAAV